MSGSRSPALGGSAGSRALVLKTTGPYGCADLSGTATTTNASAVLLTVGPFTPTTGWLWVDFTCAIAQSVGPGTATRFEVALDGVVAASGGFSAAAANFTYPFAMGRRVAVTPGLAVTVTIVWAPMQNQTITCSPANSVLQFASVCVWPG